MEHLAGEIRELIDTLNEKIGEAATRGHLFVKLEIHEQTFTQFPDPVPVIEAAIYKRV